MRELWRKKGPVGKFHNTVSFIRKNPQRREAFLETCGNGITSDIKGERLQLFIAKTAGESLQNTSLHGVGISDPASAAG